MFILSQNQDEIFRGDFFDRYAIVEIDGIYCIQGSKYESNNVLIPPRILAKYPAYEATKAALLGLLDALSREQNMIFPDYQGMSKKGEA